MMMRGDAKLEKARVIATDPMLISGERALDITGAIDAMKQPGGGAPSSSGKIEAFGLDIMKEEGGTE